MSDLIRREDAIERLGAYLMADAQIEYAGTASTDIEDWKEIAEDILRGAPSADRKGTWIDQEDCWQCSECGDEYVLDVDVKPIDARMNFCPNCGADMRGADDE